MDEKDYIILMLVILFLGTVLLVGYEKKINADIEAGKFLALNWACMDGCYNMLEVIYGEVTYDNSTQKGLHSSCTEMCVLEVKSE